MHVSRSSVPSPPLQPSAHPGRRLAARAQMGWLPLPDHQGWQQCAALFAPRRGIHRPTAGHGRGFRQAPRLAAILDGELCLIDPGVGAHFYRLMPQMRTSHPDESQLMFMAFDLLHQDGVDLRALPLSDRKRDLHRLCRKSPVPFMREVQTFPNGTLSSSTATSSGSRASCPSAWRRAIRADRAAIGSRRSARAGSASIRSDISCSRDRASLS